MPRDGSDTVITLEGWRNGRACHRLKMHKRYQKV
jgi:hypothetical protein